MGAAEGTEVIAEQLMRVIEQLGGRLYVQASGNLALSGVPVNDPLREKILWLVKKHKANLVRIITTPPPTREQLTTRLEHAIQQEHALDLFDKHDLTFKIESELATAAMQIQRENEAVDAMRVDFNLLIPAAPVGQMCSSRA